jgi:hypothetical protein
MKTTRPFLFRALCMVALGALPTIAFAQTPPVTTPTVYYYGTPARLTNVAVRSTLAPGESLITGFVVSNPSTATVLVRAAGAALTPLGVSGAMQNPRLQIIDTAGHVVAQNDDWSPVIPPSSAENPAWSVQHASEMIGAFPFSTSSRDAAVVVTLPAGGYTLVVSGSTNTDAGVVLAEVYHLPVGEAWPVALARGNTPQSRILNLSARGRIAGNTGMIGGFIAGGIRLGEGGDLRSSLPSTGGAIIIDDPRATTPIMILPGSGIPQPSPTPEPPFTRRFLIRVVGPTLAGFSVANALADPTLELARTDGIVIQTNDNWDSDPAAAAAIRDASVAVGAFPLMPGSRDAAVVVSLPEGSYTVNARGANGTSGAALIEIYELEN